jgi:hypothetical protein
MRSPSDMDIVAGLRRKRALCFDKSLSWPKRWDLFVFEVPMRRLLSFAAQFGMLAAFPAGIAMLFVAWQLQNVSVRGLPEPHALTLAELIDRGPGDNIHVQLSKFTFEKPIIETNKEQITTAWVAMWPAGKRGPTGNPPVVWRTSLANDKDELDALMARKNISAMVASALPDCRLKVYPAPALFEVYPKLDPTGVIVLADPELIIEGHRVLTSDQLFDSATPRIAWGAGAGTLILGFVFMLAWRRLGSRPAHRSSEPIANLSDNFRLTERTPVSTHEPLTKGVRQRIVARFGGSLLMVVMGLMALGFAAWSFRELSSNVIIAISVAGAFVAIGGLILFVLCLAEYAFPLSAIVLFHGGIRWECRRHCYTALWADIESVYRQESNPVSTERKGTLTLVLRSGKRLQFSSETLSNYNQFADGVQQSHAHYALGTKQRELSEFGEVWFGDIGIRRDGMVLDDRFVPWTELERVEVASGQLRLHVPKSWHKCKTFALKDIPNLDVLLSMLRPSGSRDGLRNALSLSPSR